MKTVESLRTAGSSFWGSTVRTTLSKLIQACGNPSYKSGDTKVQYVWTLENDEGIVFSIYDWREYQKITEDESIEWHIGGFNTADTNKVKLQLEQALKVLA
jgi:hypothetical protein